MEALKNRKFFSFCFVPLIPYSFATVVKCTICGYTQETDKEQLEAVRNNDAKAGGKGPVQGNYV